ncbi:MAG TPA: 3-hydroxyacyl-CoA dehydrogenase NAD-binding domain-containing protein, partial [Gammaproteobacteria bacterium]|nr:3-hydroxyacyl-CoA dehydrogenase NAD-binding domain-containing protein [Gammaproteobacteria bacterium]
MLEKFKNVAVIGAGTMGMGIAEVAATAGHNVKVYDLNSEFAEKSKQKMMDRLNSRVQRGKISKELSQQVNDHVSIVTTLSELSDSHLVIEAIVENIEIKQNLFKELQEKCNANTLYATNTSSISVTAIASVLNQPENMIGLHFFNPAPVMQLVEVIAGLKSSQENLEDGLELCRSWKKMPVLAKSTPGFIVNRVARPFYGEALKMLQEQVSNHATIDCVMKSAGFRMGPFELMDLIGIDVNLSVSKTVYQEMFY